MRLTTTCSGCREQIRVPALMIDNRIELAKKKGMEFELRCEKCGQQNKVHVDDIKAVEGLTTKLVGIVSIFLAIVLTRVFWKYGFIASASFAIPILLITSVRKNQHMKIKQFNLLKYDSKRLKK